MSHLDFLKQYREYEPCRIRINLVVVVVSVLYPGWSTYLGPIVSPQ